MAPQLRTPVCQKYFFSETCYPSYPYPASPHVKKSKALEPLV